MGDSTLTAGASEGEEEMLMDIGRDCPYLLGVPFCLGIGVSGLFLFEGSTTSAGLLHGDCVRGKSKEARVKALGELSWSSLNLLKRGASRGAFLPFGFLTPARPSK